VIIRAAHQAAKEGVAHPLLLGDPAEIRKMADAHHISIDGLDIIDHRCNPYVAAFTEKLAQLRQRKGWSLSETTAQLRNPYIFGAMLVREGLVDGQVHGINQSYPNAIRPVLQVIPAVQGSSVSPGFTSSSRKTVPCFLPMRRSIPTRMHPT